MMADASLMTRGPLETHRYVRTNPRGKKVPVNIRLCPQSNRVTTKRSTERARKLGFGRTVGTVRTQMLQVFKTLQALKCCKSCGDRLLCASSGNRLNCHRHSRGRSGPVPGE